VRAERVDAGAQVEEQAGDEQQAEDANHHQVARQRRQHLLLVHVGHLAAREEDTSAQPAAAGVPTKRGTADSVVKRFLLKDASCYLEIRMLTEEKLARVCSNSVRLLVNGAVFREERVSLESSAYLSRSFPAQSRGRIHACPS
jgi:hypothetical protein